jgi:hypothetical protein
LKESKLISVLLPLSFLFYLALNIISWNFPFFWDSLLTSTIVQNFYENGLNGLIVPEKLDAGHPPIFYLYLFSWWKIAMPSLTISHLSMLPFLWIMIYQFLRLSGFFIKKPIFIASSVLLFLLDPGILSQASMVSYDIVILMLYITAIRSVLLNRNTMIIVATIFLPLISIRGSFAVVSIAVSHLVINYLYNKNWNLKNLRYYIPALGVMIFWHTYHYIQVGWFFFSTSDNWIEQRTLGTASILVHNTLSIIRNLGDYGKLGVYLLLFILIFVWIYQKRKISNDLKVLVAITIIPLIIFCVFFLPFSNPIGHRYLLVVYALSFILFSYIISYFKNAFILFLIAIATLISGNFWIHKKISNGWDSTMAHIPYFKIKQEMNTFISKNKIDKKLIGSRFPLHVSEKQEIIYGDSIRMGYLGDSIDFEYILYSNISNEWTIEDLEKISLMDTIYHIEKSNIFITLYQKSDKFSPLPE